MKLEGYKDLISEETINESLEKAAWAGVLKSKEAHKSFDRWLLLIVINVIWMIISIPAASISLIGVYTLIPVTIYTIASFIALESINSFMKFDSDDQVKFDLYFYLKNRYKIKKNKEALVCNSSANIKSFSQIILKRISEEKNKQLYKLTERIDFSEAALYDLNSMISRSKSKEAITLRDTISNQIKILTEIRNQTNSEFDSLIDEIKFLTISGTHSVRFNEIVSSYGEVDQNDKTIIEATQYLENLRKLTKAFNDQRICTIKAIEELNVL